MNIDYDNSVPSGIDMEPEVFNKGVIGDQVPCITPNTNIFHGFSTDLKLVFLQHKLITRVRIKKTYKYVISFDII